MARIALVVHHEVDDGAVRQCGGFIQNQAAVFDPGT